MAAMMKKQMLASTTTKRSAVVAQAKTVKASKTVDSAFYGPNRGQFLGPFSESPLLYQPSLHLVRLLIISPPVHVVPLRMRNLIRPVLVFLLAADTPSYLTGEFPGDYGWVSSAICSGPKLPCLLSIA